MYPPPFARTMPLGEPQEVLFPDILEPCPTWTFINTLPMSEHKLVLFPSNFWIGSWFSQRGGGQLF